MTLVELLVVLTVIGIIVGMSVPSLLGYAKQLHLKTTTRQLMGLLSLARSTAISSHADHAVIIDQEHGQVNVMNVASGESLERAVRLPPKITVTLQVNGQPSPTMQFVFRSSGSLTGRTVELVVGDQDRHHTIAVTGSTGTITLKE